MDGCAFHMCGYTERICVFASTIAIPIDDWPLIQAD